MKQNAPESITLRGPPATTELLILPDGRILVHNLTPVFAGLLAELNPHCEQITSRISRRSAVETDTTRPPSPCSGAASHASPNHEFSN